MKPYLILQFHRCNRALTEFGLPPIVAYILLPLLFGYLGNHLFATTEFATYLIVGVATLWLLKLADKKRNDFLKLCFTKTRYRSIRLLENAAVALPFCILLAYQQRLLECVVLIIITVGMSFLNISTRFHFVLPTPFSKKPFEFTVGFRNSFFMFPIAYLCAIISISVGNYNIGLFALLLVYITAMTYYATLEKEYFVWSYALAPKAFLIRKIKTGLWYTSIAAVPIVVLLCPYFYTQLDRMFLVLLAGYAYLTAMILAKYAAYPREMALPEGIIIALSLLFPPALVGIIPYFFHKASQKLKQILQ